MPYIRCSFPKYLYNQLRQEANIQKVRIVDVLHTYVKRGLAREHKKNSFILAEDFIKNRTIA